MNIFLNVAQLSQETRFNVGFIRKAFDTGKISPCARTLRGQPLVNLKKVPAIIKALSR